MGSQIVGHDQTTFTSHRLKRLKFFFNEQQKNEHENVKEDAAAAAAAAKSLQLCPTLCDPTDGSPPGSAVPGMLQARILEWVAISSSNA